MIGHDILRRSTAFFVPWVLLASGELRAGDAPSSVGEKERSTPLSSLEGELLRPLDPGKGKFAAVVFITTDCPIANAFAPEFNRLGAQAKELGGKLTLIHVDWDLTAEAAAEHAKEYGLTVDVVIDRNHDLVAATGAQITPEGVVVDPEGNILYRGRINDLFTGYGDRRRHIAHHDFKAAMQAGAAGNKPVVARTEAIGCYIPELPK